MIYFYNHCKNHDRQIRYAMKSVFRILGLRVSFMDEMKQIFLPGDILIIYKCQNNSALEYSDKTPTITIENSQRLFGDAYLQKSSIPDTAQIYENYVSIFQQDEIYFQFDKNTCHTNLDIPADCFFMLTRYEEYPNLSRAKDFDQHGRFLFTSSFSARNNLLDRPLVDEQAFLLKELLERLLHAPLFDTASKKPVLFITHDVDLLHRYSNIAYIKNDILRKGFPVLKSVFDIRQDPYWNLLSIIGWEKKNKIESAFYFLPRRDKQNADYDINNRKVQLLIQEVADLGCEVGWHGSFDSTSSPAEAKREISNVFRALSAHQDEFGARQHYLRFIVPATLRTYQTAGVSYDTSLMYAGHEGFRCGTCHPFTLYDLDRDAESSVYEIPLIIMDVTLKNHRKLSVSETKSVMNRYADTIEKYHGVYTILWHNNRFFDKEWFAYNRMYLQLVKKLTAKRFVSKLGPEIINGFKQNPA